MNFELKIFQNKMKKFFVKEKDLTDTKKCFRSFAWIVNTRIKT